MVWLTEAEPPQDLRLYAIGDVHGCLDELLAVHEHIADDLSARPVPDWRIIHIGDYVDRGSDSRGVLDYLLKCCREDPRMIALLGNHDLMFEGSLQGHADMRQVWLQNGGVETLASYGMSTDDLHMRLAERQGFDDVVPPEHRAFIIEMEQSARFGDYFFVHAGIEPAVPLDQQDSEPMLWIRDRFLADRREYDAVIVHGHTPVRRVDVQPNRVGIDTGAVFGGALTCLMLEGSRKARLGAEGLMPLV